MPRIFMDADKRGIRTAFDRAAASYDGAAQLQREIAAQLLTHTPNTLPHGWVADLGCGTGHGHRALRTAFPQHPHLALDFAPSMLAELTGAAICGDIEALPLASGSLALYWSSLAWQWTDPERAAAAAAHALVPRGSLRVATLGPLTLHELEASFARVDDARHVRRFLPAEVYPPILARAGFTAVRMERRQLVTWDADLHALLRNLKALGAHHVGAQRRRFPLGRKAWQTLQTAYERYRRPAGLPATYDVIFLSAERCA